MALAVTAELPMGLIRRGQGGGARDSVTVILYEDTGLFPVATADPLLATDRERWLQVFATGALPSVRQIRREHRSGHPRAGEAERGVLATLRKSPPRSRDPRRLDSSRDRLKVVNPDQGA